MNLSPLFFRRRMLASLVSLTTVLWWRNGSAQVGSGGTGITQSIGSADLVVGEVTLRRAGQQPTGMVKGAKLVQGDLIDTRNDSEVHVAFDDGGYLAIRPNSTVRIAQYVVTGDATDLATIDLLKGALRSVTGWIGKLDAPRYRITANTATIGVRGTDHEVVLIQAGDTAGLEPGVHDHVNEGATILRNSGGVLNIPSGTAAYSPSSGARPLRHAVVPAIFDRLRTQQESAINNHAQNIRQRMEERLRERGKLRPNERFEQFRQRQQPLRQGRPDLKQSGNNTGQPQAAEATKDRQAARQALREQRQEKIRLQQESRAPKRAGQRERAGEKRRIEK